MEADGRTPAASVSYRDVTKRYPGQSSPAINHLSLELGTCRLNAWLYCRAS